MHYIHLAKYICTSLQKLRDTMNSAVFHTVHRSGWMSRSLKISEYLVSQGHSQELIIIMIRQ